MNPPNQPPQATVMQMVTGTWVTKIVALVAQFSLPDLIEKEPRTAAELAPVVGAHGESLYRLMRAAAALGVMSEDEAGRFHNTPLSDVLRADHPNSVRGFAVFVGAPWHAQIWMEAEHCIRTGECAPRKLWGMNGFEWMAHNPDAAQTFDDAMTSISKMESPAVVSSFDFSQFGSIVDVAGGHGLFLAAILRSAPKLRGKVLDLPHVIAGAKNAHYLDGLEDRAELVAGNMFEKVPPADAYVMKYIIHDWPDERAQTILRNCAASVVPGGRLLVVDQVVPPGNAFSPAKLMDMEMLVVAPSGKERTEAQFRALFEASGWRLTKVHPTPCPLSILEGELA